MKITTIFVALLLCSFNVKSQSAVTSDASETDINNLYSDIADSSESSLNFGFLFGFNRSYFYEQSSPGSKLVNSGDGIRMGLQAIKRVNNYLAIMPRAELSLNESYLTIADEFDIQYKVPVMSGSIQFALHTQVKLPMKKMQPYLIAGPSVRIPLKKERISIMNFDYKTDVALDAGIGFEKKFKHFILMPEIRYSYGFRNINTNPYIKSLYYHQLSVVIGFAG